MPTKQFEHTIGFYEPAPGIWLPIVTVNLIQPTGTRIALPLIFDTGASVTTLRHDLYSLLGVPSWDSGSPMQVSTAGGVNAVNAYQYLATLEFLGKIVQCPINLQILPPNPLYVGLLGRDNIFKEFGFGFWESDHQLHVTLTP